MDLRIDTAFGIVKIKSNAKSKNFGLLKALRTLSKNLRLLYAIGKYTDCPVFHLYFNKYRPFPYTAD